VNDHAQRHAGARSQVVGAARVVAALTLLSRVFGLLRDAVCARVFGAGPVWSAFAFAFLLPNLARRLFGEGALTGAFIPDYAELLETDPPEAHRYASAMLALVAALVTAAAVVGELVLLALYLFSPLRDSGALALQLSMLLLPFAPMICVTALLGGMLQSHGRFAPTAAAPVILNLCIILAVAGAAWLASATLEAAAFAAAAAVLIAGLLQIIWSLFAAAPYVNWTPRFAAARLAVRRTLVRTAPVVLGLGALQLNTLLDGLIASYPILVGPTIAGLEYPLDQSSNAALFFAHRLYQFPLGVFGIALATAVFPMLARQSRDPDAFASTLRDGLRLTLFIGLPASVGLILVRVDLVAVILAGGLFDASDVARVATILTGYAPAVWAYAMNHTLTRAYYARGDTTTPMRVTLAFVAINVTLNLILIWPLAEAGLAWSTAICAILQFVTLAIIWRRRHAAPGAIVHRDLARSAAWTLLLTLAMAAAVALTLELLPAPGQTRGFDALRLAAGVGVGAGVFLALSIMVGRPEPRWMLRRSRPRP